VANDLEAIRLPVGDDGEIRIACDHVRGVDKLPVDAPGKCRLAQSCTDAARHLVHRDRVIEVTLAAIGQTNDGHGREAQSLCGCRDHTA
jgi:hypothetical protein